MNQLVLTAHTGINLNFPIPEMLAFVVEHASDTPAMHPHLEDALIRMFQPGQPETGRLVLGLGEENELIGLLLLHRNNQLAEGHYQLLSLVVHQDHRGQGFGRSLLRSGKMLSRQLHISVAEDTPIARYFQALGFEVAADPAIFQIGT